MRHHRFSCIQILLVFAFLGLFTAQVAAQNNYFPRKLDPEITQDSLERIRDQYGEDKASPVPYEKAFLVALQQYPGLRDTEIEIAYKKLKTTMAARPKLNFIFRRRGKRAYQILVNEKAGELAAPDAAKLPFNHRVGVLGHELAHIADYQTMSALGIIWLGIRYNFPRYKEDMEKATDTRAIAHGFGWQVYDYASYILTQSDAPLHYKEYKRQYYLEPGEIIGKMLELGYPNMEKVKMP